MKVKKSNLEIVKSYLAGERPIVVVGYNPKKKKRSEGETWADNKGIKWVQKNGYKARINEQADIIRKTIQRKCSCGQDIRYGSKLDNKFFTKTGKCFDCIIKEETELRILGVYGYYENYKILSNYLGFLEETRQKIIDSIEYFKNETGTLEVLCNSAGFLEKFKGVNTTELLNGAKEDLNEIEKTIKRVTNERDNAKKTYHDELKKSREIK
jgi:hypothetical protein